MFWNITLVIILLYMDNLIPSTRLVEAVFKKEAQCDPAIENRPHNLTFSWKTNNIKAGVYVESHDSTIGFCNLRTVSCTTLLPGLATVTLTNTLDIYCLMVSIKNVSRAMDLTSEGYWTLKHNSSTSPFVNCTLKVLSIQSNVICNSHSFNGALKLTCLIPKIYPKARCIFFVNHTEVSKNISVKCNSSLDHDVPIYYLCICEIFISLSYLRNGINNVSVVVYPNDGAIYNPGYNITQEIKFEYPRLILRDCPADVKLGEIVTCKCEKSDYSFENLLISWLKENEETTVSSSNILQFTVTQNAMNYNCVVKNISGIIIETAFYRPNIKVTPYNLTCQNVSMEEDAFIISCSVAGVSPVLKCKFIAYDRNGYVKLKNETYASQKTLQLVNNIQYRCVLNISKSLKQSELRVVVSIYTYFQGVETEVFLFDPTGTNLDEKCTPSCKKDENLTICVSIGVSLTVLLVVAMTVFVLYKRGLKRDCCSVCIPPKVPLAEYALEPLRQHPK